GSRAHIASPCGPPRTFSTGTVELPVPDTEQEGVPLGRCEDQHRAVGFETLPQHGISGVAMGDERVLHRTTGFVSAIPGGAGKSSPARGGKVESPANGGFVVDTVAVIPHRGPQ